LNRNLLRKLVVFLLYLLTSALVLFVFVLRPGINGYSRAMFPDLVYGRGYKPFVYRTLLPSAVRAVAEVTPTALKDRISSAYEHRKIRLVEMLKWQEEYVYEYFVALALMFCCLVGFAFTLRHLTNLFYDYPCFVADLAPVGGLMVLPVFFRYYSYIYDPCTLLLFALAVSSLVTRKRVLFYVIFALASFNKETSILLSGLFLIQEIGFMRKTTLVRHLLYQASLWVAIRGFLLFLFRNNPGSMLEFHLIHNAGLLFRPVWLLYFVGVTVIFWVLVGRGWTKKPAFLRKGLLVTLIPLFSLALFFGYVDELRDYYEAFPFLFLLLVPTMVDLFKSSPESCSKATSPDRVGP
jgi:hypothetical protein